MATIASWQNSKSPNDTTQAIRQEAICTAFNSLILQSLSRYKSEQQGNSNSIFSKIQNTFVSRFIFYKNINAKGSDESLINIVVNVINDIIQIKDYANYIPIIVKITSDIARVGESKKTIFLRDLLVAKQWSIVKFLQESDCDPKVKNKATKIILDDKINQIIQQITNFAEKNKKSIFYRAKRTLASFSKRKSLIVKEEMQEKSLLALGRSLQQVTNATEFSMETLISITQQIFAELAKLSDAGKPVYSNIQDILADLIIKAGQHNLLGNNPEYLIQLNAAIKLAPIAIQQRILRFAPAINQSPVAIQPQPTITKADVWIKKAEKEIAADIAIINQKFLDRQLKEADFKAAFIQSLSPDLLGAKIGGRFISKTQKGSLFALAKLINLATPLLTAAGIPHVSVVSTAISYRAQQKNEQRLENAGNFMGNVKIGDIDELAAALADKLFTTYQQQILLLKHSEVDNSNIKKIAAAMIDCILHYVENNLLENVTFANFDTLTNNLILNGIFKSEFNLAMQTVILEEGYEICDISDLLHRPAVIPIQDGKPIAHPNKPNEPTILVNSGTNLGYGAITVPNTTSAENRELGRVWSGDSVTTIIKNEAISLEQAALEVEKKLNSHPVLEKNRRDTFLEHQQQYNQNIDSGHKRVKVSGNNTDSKAKEIQPVKKTTLSRLKENIKVIQAKKMPIIARSKSACVPGTVKDLKILGFFNQQEPDKENNAALIEKDNLKNASDNDQLQITRVSSAG